MSPEVGEDVRKARQDVDARREWRALVEALAYRKGFVEPLPLRYCDRSVRQRIRPDRWMAEQHGNVKAADDLGETRRQLVGEEDGLALEESGGAIVVSRELVKLRRPKRVA